MRFTKYNNPSKRKVKRKSMYSKQYIEERREEMYKLLASAEKDSQRDAIIKAFNVSVNP